MNNNRESPRGNVARRYRPPRPNTIEGTARSEVGPSIAMMALLPPQLKEALAQTRTATQPSDMATYRRRASEGHEPKRADPQRTVQPKCAAEHGNIWKKKERRPAAGWPNPARGGKMGLPRQARFSGVF